MNDMWAYLDKIALMSLLDARRMERGLPDEGTPDRSGGERGSTDPNRTPTHFTPEKEKAPEAAPLAEMIKVMADGHGLGARDAPHRSSAGA